MSVSLMFANGKGWEKHGKTVPTTNVGHAADGIGFWAGEQYITLEVEDVISCRTKADAREVNQGLHKAGWLSETIHDARVHETGALVEIFRNLENDQGVFCRAIYVRTR